MSEILLFLFNLYKLGKILALLGFLVVVGYFIFKSVKNSLRRAAKGSTGKDYQRYSSLDEFRTENKFVGQPFFWAVSNTIKKYGVSFPEACKKLESAGCLTWSGNVPIINLAKSDFWKVERTQKEKVKTDSEWAEMRAKEEAQGRLGYVQNKELRCIYHTLVVRNDSLNKLYQGGVEAFSKKHNAEFNDDLSKICAMGIGDLDEPASDIKNFGLKNEKDYLWFDAAILRNASSVDGVNVTFPVVWLKGRIVNGCVLVMAIDKKRKRVNPTKKPSRKE